MYRTNELYELLFQGIPDSLRNELWLVFSGAAYEVSYLKRMLSFFFIKDFLYRKQQIQIFIENIFMNHHLLKLIMIQ
jgi:hypothetical protein